MKRINSSRPVWLRRQEGQNLPLVLVAMGVGIVLISGLLSAVDQRLTMVRDLPWKGEERYAADAGVEYALWTLANDEEFGAFFDQIGVTSDLALPEQVNGLDPSVTVELIARTETGDGHWGQQLAQAPKKKLNAVAFADAQNGWLVGQGGLVLSTTVAGESWHQLSSGTPRDLFGISALDPLRAWVVGGKGGRNGAGIILSTTNGGANWSQQSIGKNDKIVFSNHSFFINNRFIK